MLMTPCELTRFQHSGHIPFVTFRCYHHRRGCPTQPYALNHCLTSIQRCFVVNPFTTEGSRTSTSYRGARRMRAGNAGVIKYPSRVARGLRSEREETMSYSISTLLLRNLSDVFGENDPLRRRAAIDEI